MKKQIEVKKSNEKIIEKQWREDKTKKLKNIKKVLAIIFDM